MNKYENVKKGEKGGIRGKEERGGKGKKARCDFAILKTELSFSLARFSTSANSISFHFISHIYGAFYWLWHTKSVQYQPITVEENMLPVELYIRCQRSCIGTSTEDSTYALE